MDLGCYVHVVGSKIMWIYWKLLNCIFAPITPFFFGGSCKLISPGSFLGTWLHGIKALGLEPEVCNLMETL